MSNPQIDYPKVQKYIDISVTSLTTDDALRCLNGEVHVIVPTPSVKPCNNLDEYLYKSTATKRKSTSNLNNSSTSSLRRSSRNLSHHQEPFAVPLVRNFEKILKNQSGTPLGSTSLQQPNSRRKLRVDVFSRANQIDKNSGPISHLKNRLNNDVKVIIRRRRKVPYISRVIVYKGKLMMFDKHMNLYLKDVIESFTYTSDNKTFKRARHRSGIVVRGDNIILIA